MLHAKMLFPIRALIVSADLLPAATVDDLWPDDPADRLPPESPVRDVTVEPRLMVLEWPDGVRQLVNVLYEDALLMEAKIAVWVRAGDRAESLETFVPMAWLSERGS